jgi:hypothetical protein
MFSKNIAGEEVCPSCIKESEVSYRKIFDYFAGRPAATAKEIAEATGVDIKEIHRFVREKRMQLSKLQKNAICEKCAGPIFGGRFGGSKLCDDCRGKLATDLRTDFQKRHNSLKTSQNSSKSTPTPPSKPGSKDSKHPKKH